MTETTAGPGLRDVTLREFGQNVPARAVSAFTPELRLWLARELVSAGVRSFEVASTASPKVAPAMADEQLRPFLSRLGRPDGVELITLVPPNRRSFQRFFDLGLGPGELGHTLGTFFSALDEHNLANLRTTRSESLAQLSQLVPEARSAGVTVVGYVSAAFGFRPEGSDRPIRVAADQVAGLIDRLAALGAASVTLSDLQGLAGPAETEELLSQVIAGPRPASVPIGYHAHHLSPEAALSNVEAAVRAGARIIDASLGAVGGCVTGAPGNAPTEGVTARVPGLVPEPERLAALASEVGRRVFNPVLAARRSSR